MLGIDGEGDEFHLRIDFVLKARKTGGHDRTEAGTLGENKIGDPGMALKLGVRDGLAF